MLNLASWRERLSQPLLLGSFGLAVVCLFLSACGDRSHHLIVSAKDQRMVLLKDGAHVATYPVSTSKFGLGSEPGSYATPTGEFRVKKKIGEGAPHGAVFKSRRLTGEVLPVNAPGRDPIVTRILWLDGRDSHNKNAFKRFIYIHGTPEERTIGTASSYGCIRMRSADVVEVFDTIGAGARVTILPGSLSAGSFDPGIVE